MAARVSIKQMLRKSITATVASMSDTQRALESLVIQQQVLAHEWYRSSHAVCAFLSYPGEISTQLIIEDLLRQGSLETDHTYDVTPSLLMPNASAPLLSLEPRFEQTMLHSGDHAGRSDPHGARSFDGRSRNLCTQSMAHSRYAGCTTAPSRALLTCKPTNNNRADKCARTRGGTRSQARGSRDRAWYTHCSRLAP